MKHMMFFINEEKKQIKIDESEKKIKQEVLND